MTITRWREGSTRLRKAGMASRLAFFRDQELDRWLGDASGNNISIFFSGGTSWGPANQRWLLLAQAASAGRKFLFLFCLTISAYLRVTPSVRLGIDQSVHSVLLLHAGESCGLTLWCLSCLIEYKPAKYGMLKAEKLSTFCFALVHICDLCVFRKKDQW